MPTAEERVERRLTAILAADVAGYSRLMGEDEEGTLAALKGHRRELLDPKIAEHRGRIVKTTGDGLLAEFASVVDAVRCAVEVQREMAERNAGVPADQRIEFRIGINVGDIIIDEGDIYGDGVNIAARLEALAEPGGVCLSRGARDQVRDKLDFAFEDMGEQQVKNIARPVRAFRLGPRSPTPTLPRLQGRELCARAHLITLPRKPGRVGWGLVSRRRCRSPTSPRSQSCRSRTYQATPNRNTSPTAWSRKSSPRYLVSAGSSSLPATRASPTKARPLM